MVCHVLPALNQTCSSLCSTSFIWWTWWTPYIKPSLHSPVAIRPVPHPKHAITSQPCLRQRAAQVIDDSLRWKQEEPAGSPLKIKGLSCHSLDTCTSGLLQIPPMVHVGMQPFCCMCGQFSSSFCVCFLLWAKRDLHLFVIQLVAFETSTYSWDGFYSQTTLLQAAPCRTCTVLTSLINSHCSFLCQGCSSWCVLLLCIFLCTRNKAT